MAIFKKTYTIDVEIDLEDCNYDAEWGLEDWETSNLEDFIWKIQEDLEDFIDKNKKA